MRGSQGALDICATYFHTGAEITQNDLHGVLPGYVQRCTSFPALRERMRYRLGRAIVHRNSVLSIVARDFSWVTADDDRRSLNGLETSGARNRGEERRFDKKGGNSSWTP